MPDTTLPALSLTAVPGRRRATLELAGEIERRGFGGIWVPSVLGGLAFTASLAHATARIPFATSIAPIYLRQPADFADWAAYLHEVSEGRFRFGVGVSHVPMLARWGIEPGKPVTDMRRFVAAVREAAGRQPLPPIVMAAMRGRMIALAGEIADGIVFANAARSAVPRSLEALPAEKRAGFPVACMTPTCISDDEEAAKAVLRKQLTSYAQLPYYRAYWREAGYGEEMDAVEAAITAGDTARIPSLLSDRWLADVTLFGPVAKVREGVEAWRAAGVSTPILVPSSAAGNQLRAFEEMFDAFS